jgi:hypothetical protein
LWLLEEAKLKKLLLFFVLFYLCVCFTASLFVCVIAIWINCLIIAFFSIYFLFLVIIDIFFLKRRIIIDIIVCLLKKNIYIYIDIVVYFLSLKNMDCKCKLILHW